MKQETGKKLDDITIKKLAKITLPNKKDNIDFAEYEKRAINDKDAFIEKIDKTLTLVLQ